jgi:fructokinase
MRLGADVGGSKIEVAVLDGAGRERLRRRVATPHGAYADALGVLAQAIREAERDAGTPCTVGIGLPGYPSPSNGILSHAFNTPFNDRPLQRDLEAALGREIRVANDANCFALSEAVDGAARDARVVFGAILGTGAGGGVAIEGRLLPGHEALGAEWGHNPLPWMRPEEYPGPRCTCGRFGCIEQFVSGSARQRDAVPDALYADRLARALAQVVNLLSPDVIVLGGGASNLEFLYTDVPPLLSRYAYRGNVATPLRRAVHGDASGVRGAAILWPGD